MAAPGTPQDWLVVLGHRVREARVRRALSQDQLAEMAGVSRPYLSAIERGARNLGVVNLLRIAYALRVDPGEFVRELPWS
jgi:transcriptional regulator with XRE-family HTH domain